MLLVSLNGTTLRAISDMSLRLSLTIGKKEEKKMKQKEKKKKLTKVKKEEKTIKNKIKKISMLLRKFPISIMSMKMLIFHWLNLFQSLNIQLWIKVINKLY